MRRGPGERRWGRLALVLVPAVGCRQTSAWFAPDDDLSAMVTGEIAAATDRVHVAIYTFTLQSVADALQEAALRGLDVKVVADAGQSQPVESGGVAGQAELLAGLEQGGVGVCTASGSYGGILHHKFLVLDDDAVITGSANLTASGTGVDPEGRANLENLVLLVDPRVNERFEAAFEELWTCGEP